MSDKYALIAAEQATGEPAPSVSAVCAGLEVARSGFYDWQRAEPSKRQRHRWTQPIGKAIFREISRSLILKSIMASNL